MHTGKSPGLDLLTSESVKYASHLLAEKLAILFTACCKHGFVPSNFCGGKITPVPKGNIINPKCSDYRPITSINVIAKVYEYTLLNIIDRFCNINDLQMGFTKGGGCDKAVFIVKSVVDYFTKYGSNVYIATLDLTKAFDRINHCILLVKLVKLGIPLDIIIMFKYWFQNIFGVVAWMNNTSSKFNIYSGIRQGGVCSTWFFNVYINDLISILEKSGMGCHMLHEFMGCVLYADDIILLSGSVRQLQLMLNLCNIYAIDCCLTFNNAKSYCLAFGKNVNITLLPELFISDKPIKWVQQCTYLGVDLVSGKCFTTDVETRKRKFIACVNSVICRGKFLSEECLVEIICKQCLPILTYGCVNWYLNSHDKQQIKVCFNRAFRKIFNFHDHESVRDILYGFCVLPIELYVMKAKLSFIGSCLQSDRMVIKKCAQWQRNEPECYNNMSKYNIDCMLDRKVIHHNIWMHFNDMVEWN